MKFGGAALRDAAGIQNVAKIIERYDSPLLVVASAMGKTTNALELLCELATSGDVDGAEGQFRHLMRFHMDVLKELWPPVGGKAINEKVEEYFYQLNRIIEGVFLLEDAPPRIYDRIVAFGELLSSTILAEWLRGQKRAVQWLDARKMISTDSAYSHAEVLWSISSDKIKELAAPVLKKGQLVVTQGYIAANTEGYTSTLGREGSDFSAAIFGQALGAERVLIWKDVPGVMEADPKLVPGARKIDRLGPEQAVEMSYYGASVIHPKTIRPLRNAGIPLEVRCFEAPEAEGSQIGGQPDEPQPSVFALKKNQALLQITPKSFEIVNEQLIQEIFSHVDSLALQCNLMQRSAVSLLLCLENAPDNLHEFCCILSEKFEVAIQRDMVIFTLLRSGIPELRLPSSAALVQFTPGRLHIAAPASDIADYMEMVGNLLEVHEHENTQRALI